MKEEEEIGNVLFRGRRDVTRHTRSGRRLAVARGAGDGPLAGEGLARPLLDACRRHSVAAVAHGLGWQVAIVQALCAVLARRSAVLVDTLSLTLPTAHACAAGAEGCRSHDRRHGVCRCWMPFAVGCRRVEGRNRPPGKLAEKLGVGLRDCATARGPRQDRWGRRMMNQGPGLCRSRKSRWGRCGTKGRAGGPVGRWKSRVLGRRRGGWLGRGRMGGGRKSKTGRTGRQGRTGRRWGKKGSGGLWNLRKRGKGGGGSAHEKRGHSRADRLMVPGSGGDRGGSGYDRGGHQRHQQHQAAQMRLGVGRHSPARARAGQKTIRTARAPRVQLCILVRLFLRLLSYYDL